MRGVTVMTTEENGDYCDRHVENERQSEGPAVGM